MLGRTVHEGSNFFSSCTFSLPTKEDYLDFIKADDVTNAFSTLQVLSLEISVTKLSPDFLSHCIFNLCTCPGLMAIFSKAE